MTGFVFQDKYLKRLEKLSDQEVGRLVRALSVYHATGEEQELKGRECGYYDFKNRNQPRYFSCHGL